MTQQLNKIDKDWCKTYLEEKIFKMRPEDYRKEHPIWPGLVGIEIEMMPFSKASLETQPAMVPLLGEGSLQETLRAMLPENRMWRLQESQGLLTSIKLEDGDQLTFEPGGQLEYSSKPYPCLDDACKRSNLIQGNLSQFFDGRGISFLQMGSNPWQSVEDIGLQMDKPRYQAMNKYFTEIGPYGKRMMRETCTVQVNLDFGGSEGKMARRFLAANLMAPVLTAMFAHSPVTGGKANGYKSVRAKIWQNLDSGRTGFPHLDDIVAKMDRDSCVQAYLDMVLSANVVFLEKQDFSVPRKPMSFLEWIQNGVDGLFPDEQDFETHLSLHFPEVRARGFMEIRSIDSQAPAWQIVPACILTGILYDRQSLDKALELLVEHADGIRELWHASTKGLENVVLRDLAAKIMYLAQDGFRRLPPCYQGTGKGKILDAFSQRFTNQGRCPADDILDSMVKSGSASLTAEQLMRVHEGWAQ